MRAYATGDGDHYHSVSYNPFFQPLYSWYTTLTTVQGAIVTLSITISVDHIDTNIYNKVDTRQRALLQLQSIQLTSYYTAVPSIHKGWHLSLAWDAGYISISDAFNNKTQNGGWVPQTHPYPKNHPLYVYG